MEDGQSLIESIISAAIAAIIIAAMLGGVIAASAHFGPDAVQNALAASVRREIGIARDLAKYQGTALHPGTLSTALPLPDGSPLPARISLMPAAQPDGAVQVTVSVWALWNGAQRSASLAATLPAPAPLPGSTVTLPRSAPAPTGAP